MRYAKRDIYAQDGEVRRLVAFAGEPVPPHFERLVDAGDTTTEPPKAAKVEQSAEPAEVPVEPTDEVDYRKLTKAELEEKLTERGIEFSKEDKKAELLALLEGKSS